MVKLKGTSIRKVSKALGLSYGTTHNIAKKQLGLSAYHTRKVQKMSTEHKTRRLEFSKWMLAEYGDSYSAKSKYAKIVNSDFSAIIRVAGNLSSKNYIIWAE